MMKPLFMWAGGKKKMLKKYDEHLPEIFNSYCEPFLGGGAMFVWAYQKNPAAKFCLNDSNESIISIYKSVRDDVDRFISRMDELSQLYLPLSKEDRKKMYYELRHLHAYDYQSWGKTIESATLYFLMKTGFNGIWQINKNTNNRFGTPSGLLNQKDKVYDKENVFKWNRALQGSLLQCGDFRETLSFVGEGCYVFLDPPYRGSFTQYGVDFDDELQDSVVKFLQDCYEKKSYVLLSNRDIGDGFFMERKGDHKMVHYDVTYTAGRRKRTAEGFKAKKAREVLLIAKQKEE